MAICLAAAVAATGAATAAVAQKPPGPATAPQSAPAANPADAYRTLLEDGIRNNSLGRHGEAVKSFRAALDACHATFGAESPDCADAALRLALELSNEERFEEADLLFARLDKLVRGSSSSLGLPGLLTYRAMDLANRGDYDDAMRLVADANQKRKALLKTAFEKARAASPEAQGELDRVMTELAHGLYVQASISFRLGRLKEAKVTAQLVRMLIGKVKTIPDWWVSFADALLADIELRDGNVEAAEKRLRLALKAKQVALGNTRAVALSYMALGAVFREARRNADAIDTSRPGLSILRGEIRLAPGVDVDRLEPFLLAAHETAKREPGRRAELHAEMFAAAQLARTSQTARTVGQMAARFATDRPEIAELVESLQRQTQLRDELRMSLGRATIAARGKPDAGKIDAMKKAYARAADAVAALSKRIEASYPDYADLVSPSPAAADAVGASLDADEALAYFVFGQRSGYVFLVRRDGVHAALLPVRRSELGGLIRELRKPFDNPGTKIAAYDLDRAHDVYRRLLAPVEDALHGVRHLVVVSSGELLSLPFSLLVTRPPNGGDDRYRQAAWLIRRLAVTQMPSVKTFTTFRNTVRPSSAPRPFIGFGNPAFTGGASSAGIDALSAHCQLGGPLPPGLLRGLAPLPETASELTRVAATLRAGDDSVVLGGDVTEDRIRALPLDQYRVVYFATHGLLPGELRCQSQPALALSPARGPAPDRGSDGLLEASEIAALKLDADLVVLSACNTGGGGSGKLGGESLSGLARAFFQAGTRSMLVSHWQVDSIATTRLMTRTFDHLGSAGRRHAAAALQRAQVGLLGESETAHPYFWAAFTLVGEGRQIDRKPAPGGASQLGQSGR